MQRRDQAVERSFYPTAFDLCGGAHGVTQIDIKPYIGIYTKLPGLDVTHTGFFIMTPNGPVLRHASSRTENHKVMDSAFASYVLNTPGIVVLRPR
ncbi:N-acetylmuramoyl-L-alanine amidase-like domain-containing protein [Serratia fonticola]